MTVIAGLVDGSTVWLGGDSAATGGGLSRTIIKDPKVFVKGEIAFGVCGLPKVMDALAHAIELPKQQGDNDRAFLVGELVPAIRDGLKKLDATTEEQGYGTCFSGAMLIGYRGALYQLEGNFQLVRSAKGFDAVGSGGKDALGVLSMKKTGNPKKRLLAALSQAAEFNAGCAPPFVIVKVQKGS